MAAPRPKKQKAKDETTASAMPSTRLLIRTTMSRMCEVGGAIGVECGGGGAIGAECGRYYIMFFPIGPTRKQSIDKQVQK